MGITPEQFGNWHTIYTRMNRWIKVGVLDRKFAESQRAQVVPINQGLSPDLFARRETRSHVPEFRQLRPRR
jgi:hypothetical protein